MNSVEAKHEIIKLMRDSEKKEELKHFLQICSNNDDLKADYEQFEEKLKNKKIDISKYRYCWYVQANHSFGYCVNAIGKMLLIETKTANQYKSKEYIDKNKIKDSKIITLENGRIAEQQNDIDIKLSLSYDIYSFVNEVGWLDNDKSYDLAKQLEENKKNYPYERLEIHHINNNPNDNRIINLVWLPRSIHSFAHHYNTKCTCKLQLTDAEYNKVDTFVKNMRKGKVNS